VILLTAGLEAKGYETQLVVGHESPSEGNLLDLAEARGVRPVRLTGLGREIRPLGDLVVLWRLWRTMRRFRPAIVHTHTAKAGAVGRLAAWLAGVPVIAHTYHGHVLRGYFGPLKTAAYRFIERALDAVTDAPITVSEALRTELAAMKVSRPDKMRVVPLGLDLARFTRPHPRGGLRAADGISDAAPLIGVVGRLVPIKDVSTFLAAAARVALQRPDARFAVVGDGELRPRLETEAGERGLSGVVRFHGWRTDLEAVYADLDVVVNSSLNEGTPVALIEALAASRPVVATAVGGTPDLLAGGTHGTMVPAGDANALASAILDVLAHPEESRRRADEGRAYVLAHHSAERLIDDIDALYRELLGRRLEVA
jgi:glycosyltransferase involved in cell wall biosynthesis